MRINSIILLLALAGVQVASAAEIRSIDVQYEDGRYSMVSVAWLVILRQSDTNDRFALPVVSAVALAGLAVLAWTYRRIQHLISVIRELETE